MCQGLRRWGHGWGCLHGGGQGVGSGWWQLVQRLSPKGSGLMSIGNGVMLRSLCSPCFGIYGVPGYVREFGDVYLVTALGFSRLFILRMKIPSLLDSLLNTKDLFLSNTKDISLNDCEK